MPTDLNGLSILVTRPHPKGEALCEYLNSLGAKAIHFPTIDFAEPEDMAGFHASVALLGEQDYLIFVSPQAVYASVVAIRTRWPQFPPRTQFAAVGGGTALALKQAGYEASIYPAEEWSSEGLLALPNFQSIVGKKIAVVRGEGGRAFLEQSLTERGAIVLSVVAYQRILPSKKNNIEPVNVILATSFESIRNLKILVGERDWPLINNVPVIVMSERIKILAQDLGFQTIWVAPIASNEATLKALLQKRDEICQLMKMKP